MALSLCEVVSRISNKDGSNYSYLMLMRLADAEGDNLYPVPNQESDGTKTDRRVFVRPNECPMVGTVGFWTWQKIRDPEMTSGYRFTDVVRDRTLSPVEVCLIPGTSSFDALVMNLKRGIDFTQSLLEKDLIMACSNQNSLGEIEGFLCSSSELTINNNRCFLSDGVFSVERIVIKKDDLIPSLQGNRWFYGKLNLPQTSLRRLEKESEIVRKLFLEYFSWKTAKKIGFSSSVWQSLKESLMTLPLNSSLIRGVAQELDCDDATAKIYIEDFFKNIDDALISDVFDDVAIDAILESHPDLEDRFNKQWQVKNNASVIALENNISKLNEIQGIIDEKQDYLSELDQTIEEQKSALDILESQIHNAEIKVELSEFVQLGEECADIVSYDDVDSAIGMITSNLQKAGVIENRQGAQEDSFASFLYSALIVHNVPLLLLGPNGRAIADAFSCACFGRMADVVDCSREYSYVTKTFMEQNSLQRCVVLENPFNAEWIMKIPELLNHKTLCIVTHPYVEDMYVEPQSLYNYMVPVITETFVVSSPIYDFEAGVMSASFDSYDRMPVRRSYENIMEKLGMSVRLRSTIHSILTDFQKLLNLNTKSIDKVSDILYAIYPYALVSGKKNVLKDFVKKEIDKNLLAQFPFGTLFGVDDE